MSAMLKLHEVMQEAGVLDVEKLRERITPVTTFEAQAAWWLAEITAGCATCATKSGERGCSVVSYLGIVEGLTERARSSAG
jgi:hypothetical protein